MRRKLPIVANSIKRSYTNVSLNIYKSIVKQLVVKLIPEKMAFTHFKLFNLVVVLAIFIHSLEAVTLQEFQHTLKIVAKTCQTTTKVPEGNEAITAWVSKKIIRLRFAFFFFVDLLQKVRGGDYIDDQGVKVIGDI